MAKQKIILDMSEDKQAYNIFPSSFNGELVCNINDPCGDKVNESIDDRANVENPINDTNNANSGNDTKVKLRRRTTSPAVRPAPSWLQWVERNSKPKTYNFPREERQQTRWQKRGPMTRRDWVKFYEWAGEKARPRHHVEPQFKRKTDNNFIAMTIPNVEMRNINNQRDEKRFNAVLRTNNSKSMNSLFRSLATITFKA